MGHDWSIDASSTQVCARHLDTNILVSKRFVLLKVNITKSIASVQLKAEQRKQKMLVFLHSDLKNNLPSNSTHPPLQGASKVYNKRQERLADFSSGRASRCVVFSTTVGIQIHSSGMLTKNMSNGLKRCMHKCECISSNYHQTFA